MGANPYPTLSELAARQGWSSWICGQADREGTWLRDIDPDFRDIARVQRVDHRSSTEIRGQFLTGDQFVMQRLRAPSAFSDGQFKIEILS